MTSESGDPRPDTRQRSRSDPSPSAPRSNTHSVPLNLVSTQTSTLSVGTSSDVTHITTEMEGPTVSGKLEVALQGLQASLNVFPSLKLAVGGLLECTTKLKISNQNRQAYEDVLDQLVSLANQILAHVSVSKPAYVPYSIDDVARSIKDRTQQIRELRDRSRAVQFAMAEEAEQNVLKCYHELHILLTNTQIHILGTKWDNLPEQRMEMRLYSLAPADDAIYNSVLPAMMNTRKACSPNTRTKILEDLKDWTRRGDGAKIYWMKGAAGTGKTTIAYSLCKLLEADKQLGASFFCSRYSPACRNLNKIVPTIAYQLAQCSESYRYALYRMMDTKPDVAKQDIQTQFEYLIVNPLRSFRKTIPGDLVIVIDALDECSDATGTTQVLDMLLRHAAELPIKVFVTSRPEPALIEKIMNLDLGSRLIVLLYDIDDSLVQADIWTYLNSALSSLKLSAEQIDLLTARAGHLFIFAATAVRYITQRDDSIDHKERLALVLQVVSDRGTRTQGYKALDKLYSGILDKALEEGEKNQNETNTRHCLLWTAICARETTSIAMLAELLGISEKQVETTITSLQSVLNLSMATGAVSILHVSFPDFLLDHSRSGRFYCDQAGHSAYLAANCFRVMEQRLRFNICGLKSSYQLDQDVPQLQTRVDKEILPGLFYACRYWGDHLSATVTAEELLSAFEGFLTYRLLFWIEALSLKRFVDHGNIILNQALNWLPRDATHLIDFTYDARSFVTAFAANHTALTTPHIYISTLPFISKQSYVRAAYWPRTQGLTSTEGPAIEAGERSPLATWAAGSQVHSIALSGDGKSLVSGSDDYTVSVWNLLNGDRTVGPLKGHEDTVWSVAFSPNSSHVASASADGTLRLWDAQNGRLIAGPLRGHTARITSVAFSPDGTRLASGSSDSSIRTWDACTGTPLGEPFKGHQGAVLSVAFSPDGTHLASGSSDCTIRVWDVQAGTTVQGPMEGHADAVWSIAYSYDGLKIASGSDDCTVRVWDTSDGRLVVGPLQGHTHPVMSVSLSPDGGRIVSGSMDTTVRVWETTSGRLLARPLEGHDSSVNSVLFTANGTRILSSSDDQTIRTWDARQRLTGATKPLGHIGGILSVALSPDGTRLASGSSDHTICVWDAQNGTLVAGPFTGHTDEIHSVAFSPDAARIVSSSDDGVLRTWDAYTGASLVGPINERAYPGNPVAFSPDGNLIASGCYHCTIRFRDSHTGEPVAKPLEGHEHMVTSIAFSPDGTRIVSGSRDETVRMWGTNGGTAPLWTSEVHAEHVDCVAFSPDGMCVASGSWNNTIFVLDASDGVVLHGPFIGHTHIVLSVEFSPDGTQLVSGSFDQTVRVWDVESGTTVFGPLKGHTEAVQSVVFSRDGQRIISGSDDHTIRVWDIAAIRQASATSSDDWSADDEGWLTNSASQRLLWVPPDLRRGFGFLTPSSPIAMNADCTARIEDSTLLGDRWDGCYNASLAFGSS